MSAPIHQADRAYESRISQEDRSRIGSLILAGWAGGNSVSHSYAAAWDQGMYLASQRSWWRIAAEIEDQMLRPQIPKKSGKRSPRQVPVLKATGPGQVWSWDITDLYSTWSGVVFKAYKIIDIFSREIKGYRVEERESDHMAVEMFRTAIAAHGVPGVVHADSGPAMTSNALRDYLTGEGVGLSHNRPYVSNDNPFSEASFRTMKYRPQYPRIFESVEAAREYVDGYVVWYNREHRHSGIALFTPSQVDDGSWKQVWEVRDTALRAYYTRNRARFSRYPTTPAPYDVVGINLSEAERLSAKEMTCI